MPMPPLTSSSADSPDGSAPILTISELTGRIKQVLESRFPFVWLRGEISNLRQPPSGHLYFTLKDEGAQIGAVMFRGQQRQLKFDPEDGLSITGLGRVSVYEPRGTYQIILEVMEPKGVGALQLAFEHLKQKLSEEGLFDEIHKRPLPFLPERIGVVTSATGAVIRDIINVAQRRFDNINLIIPNRKLNIDKANDIECICNTISHFSDSISDACEDTVRRQHRAAVTRMNSCFFDMFHYTGNNT